MGESTILKKFYGVLKDLQTGSEYDWLQVVGYNILGFDLPFLYERMRLHHIDDAKWLYHYLIQKPDAVDLLQIHMPLNGMQRLGLKHDVLADAYGLPTKGDGGRNLSSYYFAGEYGKIEQYSEKEFIYPEIYGQILKGGIISAGKLAEAVNRYTERHDATV